MAPDPPLFLGLTKALDQFYDHWYCCLQCSNWKSVIGRPGLLCSEGKSLWAEVERIELQDP